MPCRVGIGVVQLERDAFDEVGKVVGAAYHVGARRGRRAANCDSPTVGVVRRAERLAFNGSEHNRGVSIDNRAMNQETLERKTF